MGIDGIATSFGAVGLVIFVILFVLAILWLLMPFTVFAIKDIVNDIEKKSEVADLQMKEIQATLENIEKGIKVLVEQGKLKKIAQEKRPDQ